MSRLGSQEVIDLMKNCCEQIKILKQLLIKNLEDSIIELVFQLRILPLNYRKEDIIPLSPC